MVKSNDQSSERKSGTYGWLRRLTTNPISLLRQSILEICFKLPSLFPHRSTLSAGLSYPLLEPFARTSNSQLFFPVNGAQSNESFLIYVNNKDAPDQQ